MSIAANQQRTFLRLVAGLRPHWRRDFGLPARIQAALARHREFGARDRKLYRELLYTTVRYLPWIEPLLDAQPEEAVRRVAWLAADTPATNRFRAIHATGETPDGDLAAALPAWFRPHCPEIFAGPELLAQFRRAPLWLRLQTTEPQRVSDEFAALGWPWRPAAVLPGAIELLAEVDVTRTEAWRSGAIEVQDLGSQLLLAAAGIEPGEHWLDACAGAGGKTLQLARLLGSRGQVDAHDVRRAALDELRLRASRAQQAPDHGLATIRVDARVPAGPFDGVLVDAPCSGSGTWRRSPHLKWTTTEATVEAAAAKQRRLLGDFSALVRPGGRLVYATCSLSFRENDAVVADFLVTHPEFRLEPVPHPFDLPSHQAGLRVLSARYDTDGFFVATLRRS